MRTALLFVLSFVTLSACSDPAPPALSEARLFPGPDACAARATEVGGGLVNMFNAEDPDVPALRVELATRAGDLKLAQGALRCDTLGPANRQPLGRVLALPVMDAAVLEADGRLAEAAAEALSAWEFAADLAHSGGAFDVAVGTLATSSAAALLERVTPRLSRAEQLAVAARLEKIAAVAPELAQLRFYDAERARTAWRHGVVRSVTPAVVHETLGVQEDWVDSLVEAPNKLLDWQRDATRAQVLAAGLRLSGGSSCPASLADAGVAATVSATGAPLTFDAQTCSVAAAVAEGDVLRGARGGHRNGRAPLRFTKVDAVVAGIAAPLR